MYINSTGEAVWNGFPNTGGSYTVSMPDPIPFYMLECLHCGKTFVTKPRKSLACIQSLETCWDVSCPKCEQEIRLCLHECKGGECEYALDCLTLGVIDNVLEKGIQLDFEKGAEISRSVPFQSPWQPDIYGGTSIIGTGTGTPWNTSTGNGIAWVAPAIPTAKSSFSITLSDNAILNQQMQASLTKLKSEE